MRNYGVCNHSPDYMFMWLKKVFGLETKDISIVPEGNMLPVKPSNKKRIYLFLSHKTFRLNLDRVNSKHYTKAVGMLFSNPLVLHSYPEIIPIDFEESSSVHIDAFLLKEPDKSKMSLEPSSTLIVRERTDYLAKVLDKVCSFNSLLTPLMTFLYTLPNSTHQKPVKEIICTWLYNGGSYEDLENTLNSRKGELPLSAKHHARIRNILDSETAHKYKQALQVVSVYEDDSKVPYREIVSSFNVSKYEIRYIISVVKSIRK